MTAWICWLAWSGTATALTLALTPLVRLRRTFPADLNIRTAGSERGLLRAQARPLRTLVGASAGQIALDASGDAVRRARGAVVVLRAERNGVRLGQGAGLEQSPRAGRSWQPTPPDSLLQPGVRYRLGELYFLID